LTHVEHTSALWNLGKVCSVCIVCSVNYMKESLAVGSGGYLYDFSLGALIVAWLNVSLKS